MLKSESTQIDRTVIGKLRNTIELDPIEGEFLKERVAFRVVTELGRHYCQTKFT